MRYNIILNFGYAESGSLGFVPFCSEEDFASAKEAFIDLAKFFKEAFDSKYEPRLKKCCLKNKEGGNEFCSKCGHQLKEEDLGMEDYMQFVAGIGSCDYDTFHGEYVEYDDMARWEPSSDAHLPNYENITVYVAEKSLAAALGQSPDDRVNIDQIFKDKKSDSFSFW